ncbi:trigger factor [Candidatus Saccharibacteria bacterium]|nr:trigger factor [Candidatus Saccharibacteria bacterium]
MKFTTTKQKSSVSFDVEFVSADFEPARLKALSRLARNVKIPGFRNGKAPASKVESHVDPNELAMTTLDILVREAIPKIYDEAKVQPLSAPHVDIKKFVPGEMAEVTISSDIMPEVKLPDYKKLKAKYVAPKVAEKDIDDVLKRIAESLAETKAVKRAAKMGDEVIIDFKGKKDDVAFEGGSAKDFKLKLGSGQFIPGFEEGVAGHEVGDKFELKLKFPKDYHAKDLAGADTVFEVLLKQVNEVTVPEIDDKLAKKTGAFPTLKELRADIKQNLELQGKDNADREFKDAMLDELVKGSKTVAPEELVKEQAEAIKQDMLRNIEARGAKLEDYLKQVKQTEEQWLKEVHDAAEQRVIGHLVVAKLGDELKIEVTEEEILDQIDGLREMYKKDPHMLKELEDEKTSVAIRNRLRINKTMEKLAQLNGKK